MDPIFIWFGVASATGTTAISTVHDKSDYDSMGQPSLSPSSCSCCFCCNYHYHYHWCNCYSYSSSYSYQVDNRLLPSFLHLSIIAMRNLLTIKEILIWPLWLLQ